MAEKSKTSSCSDVPLVEVIRSELRCALAEERKTNRASELRKKRPALGDTNRPRFFRTEDVADKARELREASLSMEDYISLQNSFIKEEGNINNFVEVDNVLEALVRDLTCADPAVQLIAAGCCCNIALAGCQVCTSLAKTAGPYLMAELYTLNYPLLEACVRTVGNLSAGCESAFHIWYAQGCMKPLTELIENCDDAVLPSVAYAVKHCLCAGHAIVTDSEVTDLTAAVIRRNTFSHDKEMLWILALLSSREASQDHLVFTMEMIFQMLWKVLVGPDSSNVEQVAPGIRLLGNTVTERSGKAATIFLASSTIDDIALFFDKFLSHPQHCVQKETLWFLGNLYTHAQAKIRARVRTDLVPLLSSLQQLAR